MTQLIAHPVQTNEPGRSAALLGGFLEVARQTGLPLRLLEVGASAGLNLRWDRYFYTAPGGSWGDPDSPVRFDPAFAAGAPPLQVRPQVAERRGLRPEPAGPGRREADPLTLLSYVWPDQEQPARRAARGARRSPPRCRSRSTGAGTSSGSSRCSPSREPGIATVVFHSVVLPYLGEDGVSRPARPRSSRPAPRDTPKRRLPGSAWRPAASRRTCARHLARWPGARASALIATRDASTGRPVSVA